VLVREFRWVIRDENKVRLMGDPWLRGGMGGGCEHHKVKRFMG
jgi:hypothetical protein